MKLCDFGSLMSEQKQKFGAGAAEGAKPRKEKAKENDGDDWEYPKTKGGYSGKGYPQKHTADYWHVLYLGQVLQKPILSTAFYNLASEKDVKFNVSDSSRALTYDALVDIEFSAEKKERAERPVPLAAPSQPPEPPEKRQRTDSGILGFFNRESKGETQKEREEKDEEKGSGQGMDMDRGKAKGKEKRKESGGRKSSKAEGAPRAMNTSFE